MDRKDIYEHLAKIYLDASSKKKKKSKSYHRFFENPFFIGTAAGLAVLTILFVSLRRDKPADSEIALVFSDEAVKINFHFDPAKKESYSVNLNKLDFARYKTLAFSAKKADFRDTVSLKVELTNSFREKSEVYLKDMPHKWQDYKILLSDFKHISNWSEMQTLSFIVEEWNTNNKKGVVFIDNVRLLK